MVPRIGLPLTSLAKTTPKLSIVDLNDERVGSRVACGLPSIKYKRQKGWIQKFSFYCQISTTTHPQANHWGCDRIKAGACHQGTSWNLSWRKCATLRRIRTLISFTIIKIIFFMIDKLDLLILLIQSLLCLSSKCFFRKSRTWITIGPLFSFCMHSIHIE